MRSIILGTDWWTDCDDAVAMRLMAREVRADKIDLLGICINACMEYSVASLKGFMLNEGIPDIVVGLDRDAIDFGGNPPYQKRLALNYGFGISNDDAEDPVRFYRRLLCAAKEKVEIIEIGYLQVVAELLKSPADDISNKSGRELVEEKVAKFWVMAGKWDADGEKENNFCRNSRSRIAGKEFCELCPVPVTFLGWEVGYGVITGGDLPEDDALHHALADHGSENGRHSWDPMLVLMALIGDEEAAGYDTVIGRATVDPESGANYYVRDDNGLHKYVLKKYNNEYYEKQINSLLV